MPRERSEAPAALPLTRAVIVSGRASPSSCPLPAHPSLNFREESAGSAPRGTVGVSVSGKPSPGADTAIRQAPPYHWARGAAVAAARAPESAAARPCPH